MSISAEILVLAQMLVQSAAEKDLKIATAESCTGGMIGAAITEISGSSAVFDRGFITYSNEAKKDMLGVEHYTLITKGAVSEETARDMAKGAIRHSDADISVAVTGIAGPNSDNTDKPVGLVFIAVSYEGETLVTENHFGIDDPQLVRNVVRERTVKKALEMLIAALESQS